MIITYRIKINLKNPGINEWYWHTNIDMYHIVGAGPCACPNEKHGNGIWEKISIIYSGIINSFIVKIILLYISFLLLLFIIKSFISFRSKRG